TERRRGRVLRRVLQGFGTRAQEHCLPPPVLVRPRGERLNGSLVERGRVFERELRHASIRGAFGGRDGGFRSQVTRLKEMMRNGADVFGCPSLDGPRGGEVQLRPLRGGRLL